MRLVEFVASTGLEDIAVRWRDLAGDAAEPNPFYLPEFVTHAFGGCPATTTAGAIAVTDTTRSDFSSLVGLWPITHASPKFLARPGRISGLHTPFMSCSTPLVRTGCEENAVACFLDWFDARAGTFGTLHLGEIALDGVVWAKFREVLAHRGQSWSVIDDFERPAIDLRAARSFEDYVKRMKGKKRQSLKRKWRKLAELGKLDYRRSCGGDLPAAMSDFLALERAGWKGDAGTAMALSEHTRSLAQDVLCNPQFGSTHIEALRLDGRPIAMNIHVCDRAQAYLFKPAYDQSLAPFSPGQLLHLKTVEGLFRDNWTDHLDAAVPRHDQLGAIWRDRRRIGRVLVATSRTMPKPLLDATAAGVRTYANARSVASHALRKTRRRLASRLQGL